MIFISLVGGYGTTYHFRLKRRDVNLANKDRSRISSGLAGQGVLLLEMGRTEEAIGVLDRVLSIQPQCPGQQLFNYYSPFRLI
jgi:hypothetical protein